MLGKRRTANRRVYAESLRYIRGDLELFFLDPVGIMVFKRALTLDLYFRLVLSTSKIEEGETTYQLVVTSPTAYTRHLIQSLAILAWLDTSHHSLLRK